MVYGECRAMEFAFVRNGREEADREKIRAFAEAYGLVPCGELTGANIGEAMAGNYAGERPEKAAGWPGRTGGMRPEKAAGRPGRGDTMIVADAAALGSRYEEALQAVSLAARQGISLYCVKEGLRIDALFRRRLTGQRRYAFSFIKRFYLSGTKEFRMSLNGRAKSADGRSVRQRFQALTAGTGKFLTGCGRGWPRRRLRGGSAWGGRRCICI